MVFKWLMERVWKPPNKRALFDQAEQEAVQEQNRLNVELWERVLNTTSNRVATIDEFDDISVNGIWNILNHKCISRFNEGRQSPNQCFFVSGDTNQDPAFWFKTFRPTGHEQYYILFGYMSDGLTVIKSRYEFVDRLIQSGLNPTHKNRRDALREMSES